jgi:predicted kinase
LAGQHAARLGSPALIVTYGLPGAGKSVLATNLAEKLGMDVLRSDEIRREVFNKVAPAEFNEGLYEPKMRMAVYQEMFRRAERLLSDQVSVILDATFSTANVRQQAAELAHRHGAVSCFAHCHCPADVSIERIKIRRANGPTTSDATTATYTQLARSFEPDPPELLVWNVDTTESGIVTTSDVLARLRKVLFAT